MDLPEVGWSIEVVTDGDRVLGRSDRRRARPMVLGRGGSEFLVPRVSVEDALDRAAAATARPIVLADGSDSTTAGGNGDGNELLAALLRAGRSTPTSRRSRRS